METFTANIEIIGINPFVFVPEKILNKIFEQSGKSKGKIPVRIKIDGTEFQQTLIRYSGSWRLYLNTPMRTSAKKGVGDVANFEIQFDPAARTVPFSPKFKDALNENFVAKKVFDDLTPSLQKEILRYLSFLKTDESVDRNVEKAINFLLGNERFIGRKL